MTGFVSGNVGLIGAQLTAPPGTRMSFHQAAPPLGWVTDASLSDHAMRVVTSGGGASGGTTNHSTYLGAGTFNLNGINLTTTHLPSHAHTVNISHGHTLPITALTYNGGGFALDNTSPNFGAGALNGNVTGATINNNGSGTTITPTITTPSLKFTAFIVAQKS